MTTVFWFLVILWCVGNGLGPRRNARLFLRLLLVPLLILVPGLLLLHGVLGAVVPDSTQPEPILVMAQPIASGIPTLILFMGQSRHDHRLLRESGLAMIGRFARTWLLVQVVLLGIGLWAGSPFAPVLFVLLFGSVAACLIGGLVWLFRGVV